MTGNDPQPRGLHQNLKWLFGAAASVGIPWALWTIFNDVLDPVELIYYRAGLIALGSAALAFALSKSGYPRARIASLLLIVLALGLSWTSYSKKSQRVEQAARMSPFDVKVKTTKGNNSEFSASLGIRNTSQDVLVLDSYGVQNDAYGYYRDLEPDTVSLAPGQSRDLPFGIFPDAETFSANVQVVHHREGQTSLLAIKAKFGAISQGQSFEPTENRIVPVNQVTNKKGFIQDVMRTVPGRPARGKVDFNVTQFDGDELWGYVQTPGSGRIIVFNYFPDQSEISLTCGAGRMLGNVPIGERSFPRSQIDGVTLPLVILADRFDQKVEFMWDYDTGLCSLRVNQQEAQLTHPAPLNIDGSPTRTSD